MRSAAVAALLAAGTTASSQIIDSLPYVWQSPRGFNVAEFVRNNAAGSPITRFDLDGDGAPEFVLERRGGAGELQDVAVIRPGGGGGVFNDTIMVRDLAAVTQSTSSPSLRMWGFGDVDGDAVRELIVHDRERVYAIDPRAPGRLNWTSPPPEAGAGPLRLIDVTDVSGDGYQEVEWTYQSDRRLHVASHRPIQ